MNTPQHTALPAPDRSLLTLFFSHGEDLHALAAHTGRDYIDLLAWFASPPIQSLLKAHRTALRLAADHRRRPQTQPPPPPEPPQSRPPAPPAAPSPPPRAPAPSTPGEPRPLLSRASTSPAADLLRRVGSPLPAFLTEPATPRPAVPPALSSRPAATNAQGPPPTDRGWAQKS